MQAEFQCSYSLQLLLGNQQRILTAHFRVSPFAFPLGRVLVLLHLATTTDLNLVPLKPLQHVAGGGAVFFSMRQMDEPRQRHTKFRNGPRDFEGPVRLWTDRIEGNMIDWDIQRPATMSYTKKKTGEALSDEVTTRDTSCKALTDRVSQKDTDGTP